MSETILGSLDQNEPPKGSTKPLQALWWCKKGELHTGPEWEKAHMLCQNGEGSVEFDLIHALLHWIEGDMGNADYWYHRAGEKRAKPSVSEEWVHLVERFGGENT